MTGTSSQHYSSVHDLTVQDIRGNDVDLNLYRGKVLLIVNVASQCGLTTSNYTELNEVYAKYKDQGLEILAFPCNQFGGQEPGDNEQIAEVACTRFKAEFPIFDKVEVNGSSAAPMYKFLKSSKGGIFGEDIKWNFTKFLVDKDGNVVERYAPTTSPLSIENDVKKAVMASSSKSNFTIMATSSNFSPAATGVSSVSGNQLVEWQWQTDDLRWRSYDASCSAAIEAAHARGESSVEISVDQASTSTCVIYFQSQALRQVNLRTQRQRVVSRHAIGQGSTAIWQWWEAESNCWCRYDHQLASKFETAWLESRASQRSNKLDCPAGVLFKVNGQDYSLSFEADGMQYNVNDSCYRSVRRCIYLPNQQPSSSESPAMEKCHSLNASTVSLDQARSNKSEQPNISKDEHSYLIACPNPNDGENCSVCLSSLQEDEAVELAKCHHFFHRECITQWFKTRPSCPECLTIYGVITGTQPPGDMSIRYIPVKRRKGWDGLEGYPGVDIIEITYTFPNGIQTAEHPSPGNRYTGTKRVAYLPKNKEGEEVLELLKTAWNRRLIFTVGTSVTTGRSNTVVWAGIHHKTQKYGGSSNYGYPDEGYFDRVKKELALVNVI